MNVPEFRGTSLFSLRLPVALKPTLFVGSAGSALNPHYFNVFIFSQSSLLLMFKRHILHIIYLMPPQETKNPTKIFKYLTSSDPLHLIWVTHVCSKRL